MPMFQAHLAWSAGLISLVVGTAFLVWLKKQEANGFAKLVAYVTILFSITGLACTTYYALRYWNDGYYRAPFIITHDQKEMGMMQKMMMEKSGMMNMANCPMMQEMMKKGMGQSGMSQKSGAETSPAVEDHEAHH